MKVIQNFGKRLGYVRVVAMAVGKKWTYEVQKRVGPYYYSEGPRYNTEEEAYEHAIVVLARELKDRRQLKEDMERKKKVKKTA